MLDLIRKVIKDEGGVCAETREHILDFLTQEIKKNEGSTTYLKQTHQNIDLLMYWNPVRERYFWYGHKYNQGAKQ